MKCARMVLLPGVVLGLVMVAGCGATVSGDGDGGTPGQDVGTGVSTDGGADAPVDGDGDGIVAGVDCNDADATVGSAATRPCSTACGAGSEVCTAGVWAACNAPTDCTCTTPGAMRIAPCPRCGTQSEQCTGGMWQAVSACIGQGACEVAAVETMTNDYCGQSQRICGTTCAWSAWTVTVPNGECRANILNACPSGIPNMCDATCHWVTPCP